MFFILTFSFRRHRFFKAFKFHVILSILLQNLISFIEFSLRPWGDYWHRLEQITIYITETQESLKEINLPLLKEINKIEIPVAVKVTIEVK